MDDVRGDFLGPPHGTTPAAVIANKKLLDLLEAGKHSKREYGPYCTISGNEPSSVTLFQNWQRKPDILLQFKEFTFVSSKSKTRIPKGTKQ